MTPDVGVVILHYRNWPQVRETLDAVLAQVDGASVVVVDNNSADGSPELIAASYSEVQVVRAPTNGGYASGMNLGVRAHREVDALLLLTHECLLARGAVAALLERLAACDDVGIVGPLLGWRSRPDVVWSGGGGFGRRTGRTFHRQDPLRLADWVDDPVDVPWVDGAAMLVRRSVFQQVGGFDEGYFMYDEEVDLALRVRRQGWRVECVPAAVGWQEPGMAPPYLATRNRIRLLARNRGMRRHLPFALADTTVSIARGLMPPASTTARREAALRLAGLRDALLGRLDRVRIARR